MRWGRKWSVLMALWTVLSGCTRVTVVGADGEVTTDYGIGIIKLETHPNRRPQIIRSTGIGIISRDGGVFEHSVANMYLIPIGMLAGDGLDLGAFVANLVPVTLGNVIGGSVFVALVYWLVYLRQDGAL